MKLCTLFNSLRSGMFKILNDSNDSLLALGDVYFSGSGTNIDFSEFSIDKNVLFESLVTDIYVGQSIISIYVDLGGHNA